ncbi:pentatricopeptide repeat-containing protein At5g16640, mitochondrial-like [Gossypium hirsutum]|uniref:Pentatricopeptide repeat-containing protein At5g16640, mitochondrial-like n=1 Tax=Gossypium hirsutum TaxID=3635 RepID=A0ABM3BJ44_GOSHI|nr:pentatricopeptide repeat-containing protein At5g16640, mitochondrial-like [Gossypium hirsutum]
MGKLPSSFIIRSVVNGGSHLSNFHSFSSSSNTIATHIETLSKKPMPVREKGKRGHRFDNVDDALILFNKMTEKHPKPSIVEFTKLLAPIGRMKHYAIVVSMCSQMELLGVSHNAYSLNILINCWKMLKLGVEPDVVTFSTLINGFCNQNKIFEVVSIFDEMAERGYQAQLIAYNTILKGLCKIGNIDRAEEATRLLNEMVDNNIPLDIVTYNLLIDALCKDGKISKAVETVDMMTKQGIEPNMVVIGMWYIIA